MNQFYVRTCTSALAITCSLLMPSGIAVAQEAPAPTTQVEDAEDAAEDDGRLEEILVTAQHRRENLQEVPISVAAVSGETLTSLGVGGTRDLTNVVPGLQLNQSLSAAQVYVRGVGQNIGQIGVEPPTAVYVDDVYLAQAASGLFSFNNIDQVAVLRGPQSTLFGRNTTGGVIQVTTRRPSFTSALVADIGYGNYETISGHIYATGPVSEKVAASIALQGLDQNEGFGRNIALDIETFDRSQAGGQLRLLWQPDAQTDIDLNVVVNRQSSSIGLASQIFPGSLGQDRRSVYRGRYLTETPFEAKSKTGSTLASVRASREIGSLDLVSISAAHFYSEDTTFTNNGLPAGFNAANTSMQDNSAETYTQEFRLQSSGDQRFTWSTGVYFLRDEVSINFGRYTDYNLTRTDVLDQSTSSYAAFAQGTFALTKATKLTIGGRYTIDKKNIGGYLLSPAGVVTTTVEAEAARTGYSTKSKWEAFTSRVALDHQLADNVLLYASYNRGFKSGGYSLGALNNPPVDPEHINAYEIGAKTELFDRRLRVNTSVFFYDYQDIQLRSVRPPSTVILLQNAAAAEVRGLELEFDAAVSSGFRLTGGLSYLDAKYTDFLYRCPTPSPTGGNPTTVLCDLSGSQMMRAPDFTANLNGIVDVDLKGSGNLQFGLGAFYNSGFPFEPDGRLQQDSYVSMSGTVTWTAPDESWNIQLWGANLLDEDIYASAQAAGSDAFQNGPPRTYGIRIGIRR